MKMSKVVAILVGVVAIGVSSLAGVFYWQNLRGIGPVVKGPPEDIAEVVNTTGMPLTLPSGFSIEIFAKNLPGARVLKFDEQGNLWVSQTGSGLISLVYIDEKTGAVQEQSPVFRGLRKPHGLAFDPQNPFLLYFAEEHQISKSCVYCDGGPEKIADLPTGGNHFTRTLGIGPDKKLYVANGSTCNVCNERDPRRSTMEVMNTDGTDRKEYARGLRNSVFFVWDAKGRLWATEMGRDLLGDDLPPDEINILEEGGNYGWPICYGKNVHDTNFDKNTYIRAPCQEPFEKSSTIDIPAHSAPLGLSFSPKEWPAEFANDLFVAYHGSWNRSTPTGYKVVRHKFDDKGTYLGVEDFISGWLTKDGALGRPADVVAHKGALYISDDKAGIVYKVTYRGK